MPRYRAVGPSPVRVGQNRGRCIYTRSVTPFVFCLCTLASCHADRLVGVHTASRTISFAPGADEARGAAARLPACGPGAAPAGDWRQARTRAVRGTILVPPEWARLMLEGGLELWIARDTTAALIIQGASSTAFMEISSIDGYVTVLGGTPCAGVLAGVPTPYRVTRFVRSGAPADTMFAANTELRIGEGRAVHLSALGRGSPGFERALAVAASLRLPEWSPAKPD